MEVRRLLSAVTASLQAPAAATVDFDYLVSAQLHKEPANDSQGHPLYLQAKFDFGDGQGATYDTALTAGADGNYDSAMNHEFFHAGTYTVTVSYLNGDQFLASAQQQVQVSHLSAGGVSLSLATQQHFSGSVGTFTSDAPPGAVKISWGDGGLSDGTITDLGHGSYQVNGEYTYTDPGSFDITATVTFPTLHDAYGTVSRNMITSAADVTGDPPPINGMVLPHADAIAGASYSALLAQFDRIPWAVAGNPGSDTPTVKIDWGDGSQPDVLTDFTTGGSFTVDAGHTFARSGTFDATISLYERSDLRSAVHTQIVVDQVGSGGRVLSLTTGQEFQGVVGTFTSTDMPSYLAPGEFPCVIDWGDGRSSVGTIVPLGNNQFQVEGRHAYAKPGAYAIAINAVQNPPPDPTGTLVVRPGSLVVHSSADVTGAAMADAPPPGAKVTVLPQPPGVTSDVFVNELAKLTGVTPEDAIPDVEIHYLDGQHVQYGTGLNVEEKTGVWDGSAFTTNASASYPEGGTYHIQVTFKSGDIVYGTVLVAVPINQNPPGGVTFNAVAGTPFTGVVGTLTDTRYHRAPDQIFIDWGDGSDQTNGAVTAIGNDQYQVTSTHTYATSGEYRLNVHALYHVGPQLDDESLFVRSTAEVATVPPSAATQFPATITGVMGDLVWNDLGVISDSYNGNGATATVRWGDGTPAESVQLTGGQGHATVNGRHTYQKAGRFTATILVRRNGKILSRLRRRILITRNSPGGLNLSASAGEAFTGALGTMDSPSGVMPRIVYISWGDGAVTQSTPGDGTLAAIDANHFRVTASHTYEKRGRYQIKVTGSNYPDPQTSDMFSEISSTIVVKTAKHIARGRRT